LDIAVTSHKRLLVVNFFKGQKDNPKINAILLVKGSLEDTDYKDYTAQLEVLEREIHERERVVYFYSCFLIVFSRDQRNFKGEVMTMNMKILKMTFLIQISPISDSHLF